MIEPYYDRDGFTLYHDDCRNVLPLIPSGSVDLVLTDPPYFRVKDEPWDRQWASPAAFLEWIGGLCNEWRRVLKPNGTLAVFASPDMAWFVEREVRERFNVLNSMRWVKDAGWHNKTERAALRSFLSPWEAVIVAEQWADEYEDAALALHKQVFSPLGRYIQQERERAGMSTNQVEVALGFVESKYPDRGTRLCARWEEGSSLPTAETYERLRAVLNASGGEYLRREYEDLRREYEDLRREYEDLRREYEDLRRPFTLGPRDHATDIVTFQTVRSGYLKHPCEKPLSLIEYLIRTTTKTGALVLDCFAGSGTTLEAARNLNRTAIGVESVKRHCDETVARLSQSVLPMEVPA
jgi:adenine-specific DNA-methyltransferase